MTPEEKLERRRAQKRAAAKRWADKNKDKVAERNRVYRERHHERLIEYDRERLRDPVIRAAHNARQRARHYAQREECVAKSRARRASKGAEDNARRRAKWQADPDGARAKAATWREANRDKHRAYARADWERHRERRRAAKAQRYRAEPEKRREKSKLWSRANPERVKANNAAYRQRARKVADAVRYREDLPFRVTILLRARLRNALRRIKAGKSASTFALLGCTAVEFVAYLEAQFLDGMTWENQGPAGWHIDHIQPCHSFDLTDPEQQRACFHYTNLRPLWAKDNLARPRLRRIAAPS